MTTDEKQPRDAIGRYGTIPGAGLAGELTDSEPVLPHRDTETGAVTYDPALDVATQNRRLDAALVREFTAGTSGHGWTRGEVAFLDELDDSALSSALAQARASFDPDLGSRAGVVAQLAREGRDQRYVGGEFATLIALRNAGLTTYVCPICGASSQHRRGCGFWSVGDGPRGAAALQVAHESAVDLPPGWGSAQEPDGVLSVLHDREVNPQALARLTRADLEEMDQDYLAPAAERMSRAIREEYTDFTDFTDFTETETSSGVRYTPVVPADDQPVGEWTKAKAQEAGLAVIEHVLRREIAAGRLTDEHRDGIDAKSLLDMYDAELGPAIDKIEDRLGIAYGR